MDAFLLSEEAIQDIDAIWSYLAEQAGAKIADHVVDEFFEAFERLATMPYSGHSRRDLTERPVRIATVRSYLVFYVPATKPIQILAILHGRRNIRRLLKERL